MGKSGPNSDKSCSGALSRRIVHRVNMAPPCHNGVHFDAVVPKMSKQDFAFPASTRTMFLNWNVQPLAIHDERQRENFDPNVLFGAPVCAGQGWTPDERTPIMFRLDDIMGGAAWTAGETLHQEWENVCCAILDIFIMWRVPINLGIIGAYTCQNAFNTAGFAGMAAVPIPSNPLSQGYNNDGPLGFGSFGPTWTNPAPSLANGTLAPGLISRINQLMAMSTATVPLIEFHNHSWDHPERNGANPWRDRFAAPLPDGPTAALDCLFQAWMDGTASRGTPPGPMPPTGPVPPFNSARQPGLPSATQTGNNIQYSTAGALGLYSPACTPPQNFVSPCMIQAISAGFTSVPPPLTAGMAQATENGGGYIVGGVNSTWLNAAGAPNGLAPFGGDYPLGQPIIGSASNYQCCQIAGGVYAPTTMNSTTGCNGSSNGSCNGGCGCWSALNTAFNCSPPEPAGVTAAPGWVSQNNQHRVIGNGNGGPNSLLVGLATGSGAGGPRSLYHLPINMVLAPWSGQYWQSYTNTTPNSAGGILDGDGNIVIFDTLTAPNSGYGAGTMGNRLNPSVGTTAFQNAAALNGYMYIMMHPYEFDTASNSGGGGALVSKLEKLSKFLKVCTTKPYPLCTATQGVNILVPGSATGGAPQTFVNPNPLGFPP